VGLAPEGPTGASGRSRSGGDARKPAPSGPSRWPAGGPGRRDGAEGSQRRSLDPQGRRRPAPRPTAAPGLPVGDPPRWADGRGESAGGPLRGLV